MLNNNQMAVNTYWQRTFRPDSLCVSVSPPGIWHPHPQGRIPFLARSRPSWVWTAEASVCSHLEDKKKICYCNRHDNCFRPEKHFPLSLVIRANLFMMHSHFSFSTLTDLGWQVTHSLPPLLSSSDFSSCCYSMNCLIWAANKMIWIDYHLGDLSCTLQTSQTKQQSTINWELPSTDPQT